MKFVIYTHTDYLDIFTIQQDHFLAQNITDAVIFSNIEHDTYKYPVITYNDTLPYASRILSCLEKLDAHDYEHFIMIHDNDILIKHDMQSLIILSDIIRQNNLARISLHIYINPHNQVLKLSDTLSVIRNFDFYTFSVGPSIWNLTYYKDILENNKNCSYRSIEGPAIEYMRKKGYMMCNVGGIPPYSSFCNRHLLECFQFLHISVQGQFVIDNWSMYSDYSKYLYNHYKIKRDIWPVDINYSIDYHN